MNETKTLMTAAGMSNVVGALCLGEIKNLRWTVEERHRPRGWFGGGGGEKKSEI